MQGRAYEGIKSKIGRNMKVINRVNREKGFVSPVKLQRPQTAMKPSPKKKSTLLYTDRDIDGS